MTSPGKGRYTDYDGALTYGADSIKNQRLNKQFNNNVMTEIAGFSGKFYAPDSPASPSPDSAATTGQALANILIKRYNISISNGGEIAKVENESLKYFFNAPDTQGKPDANGHTFKELKNPPANAYIPDLRSPGNSGNGTVNLTHAALTADEAKKSSQILPKDYKASFVDITDINDKFALGTVSPHISSAVVGATSIGSNLTKGSSTKT